MNSNTPLVKTGKCCVCGSTDKVKRCGGCRATMYCSKKCQSSHRSYHATFCSAITDLEKLEIDKLYRGHSVRQQQLDTKTQTKIVKLVGEKPILRCRLDGKPVDVLWDTGSMVSLVDRNWARENFPHKKIHSVSEFLEEREQLRVTAANSTDVKIDGVMLLEFTLGKAGGEFYVPVLVGSEDVVEPILGYNVIEHLLLNGSLDQHKELEACLRQNCAGFKVESLATLVGKKAQDPDFLAEIKSPSSITVPAGRMVQVKSRVKTNTNESEQTVFFNPKLAEGDDELTFLETVSTLRRGRTNHVVVEVINSTSKDKILPKGMVIGSVHSVSAVIPMVGLFDIKKGADGEKEEGVEAQVGVLNGQVRNGDVVQGKVSQDPHASHSTGDSVREANEEGEGSGEAQESGDQERKWDLSHLDATQRELMEKVLSEVEDVFSKNDSDIGDIPDFQMPIHLEDNVPVTEAYRRIPPHLYQEVKNYIEDLRNNGWVRESFSSFASPIVCIRKKGWGNEDVRGLSEVECKDQAIFSTNSTHTGYPGYSWRQTVVFHSRYVKGLSPGLHS